MPSSGELENIQTTIIPFIFIYLFPSLRTPANQATAELGSHECSSQNWDKMNTLCLISANPGQKLKEEEEEERLVGGPVRSQF